jgi:predicted ABC-type ATPase
MPHMIIVAGPNGAGKTTAAPALLKEALQVDDFVNADIIAQGLCAFQPEKEAIRAGRIMLERIHGLVAKGINFAFETTLASRSFASWIPEAKKNGYHVQIVFLWLESVELAISRVQERIRVGGHAVPEETIRRRYHAGIKNFFNLYRPLLDCWKFYNNSKMNNLSVIASGVGGDIDVENNMIWQELWENYCGE